MIFIQIKVISPEKLSVIVFQADGNNIFVILITQILLIVIIPATTRLVVYRFYYWKYRIVSITATRIVAFTMTTTFTTYVHQNMGSIHRHQDAPATITPRM